MRRQDKYPNTDIFHYLNVNPKNRFTTDCVIRAIATALVAKTGGSLENDKLCKDMWRVVLDDMAEIACNTGYFPTNKKCYEKYLKQHGFLKYGQPRHLDNTKLTLKEFMDGHKSGTYVIHLPHHLTVVVDGVNYDIYDCTKFDSRVGIFWGAN